MGNIRPSSSSGETVIVVVDLNRSKGSTDALEWALSHVVRPRDAVVVLGIISDSLPRKKAPPASCFPGIYMGIANSSIWERLEFSVQGDVEPKVLEDEIMKTREDYHRHLQPFYRQCNKNNVKLEVKLAVGFSPKNISIEEAQNNRTRWIVLDSSFKKERDYIHGQIGCNTAVMKGKDVATILPSVTTERRKLVKNLSHSGAPTPSLDTELLNNENIDPFIEEEKEALPSQTALTICWCPLSWRPGFPTSVTCAELETITNCFSDANVVCEEKSMKVYHGILKEAPVLVKQYTGNHEQFWSELDILSRIRHRNILNLVGYCSNNDSMFLLFDSACNMSLRIYLESDVLAKDFSWKKRWNVAMGICSSLRYLHEECQDGPIVHLSLCSSHVLLSHTHNAMLANFTWAKRITDANGSEPASFGAPIKEQLSVDTCAFGLVLLELMTGRCLGFSPGEKSKLIEDWALPLLENSLLTQLMDQRLEGSCEVREIKLMVKAALLCLKNDSSKRASISEVEAAIRGDKHAELQF